MFIECVQRHLGVCAYKDLSAFAKNDPKFWNLISLLGPEAPDPSKIGFRGHHRACFHDVGSSEIAGSTLANLDAMREVLKFVDIRQIPANGGTPGRSGCLENVQGENLRCDQPD